MPDKTGPNSTSLATCENQLHLVIGFTARSAAEADF